MLKKDGVHDQVTGEAVDQKCSEQKMASKASIESARALAKKRQAGVLPGREKK